MQTDNREASFLNRAIGLVRFKKSSSERTRRRIVLSTVLLGFSLSCLLASSGLFLQAQADQGSIKQSRFFQVDTSSKKIVGPANHLPPLLKLDLVSVSMDQ